MKKVIDFHKTCGKRLEHTPGKRKKQYCSDGCRMDWWNAHQDEVKRKAFYQFTCVCCGKSFSAYGNAKRSYCSHECYINTTCLPETPNENLVVSFT